MNRIKSVVIIVISVIVASLGLYFLVLCIPPSKQHVDVVFMGDSIFGNYRDETSIPALFGNSSGMSVYNGGLGGTQASMYTDYANRSVIQNGTSLVSMARAACLQDYTYVKASLPVLNVASLTYFPESVDGSSHIDFNGVKYIIVEYGLNDYFADRQAINSVDEMDISSYKGALLYSVRMLKKYYPDAKIVIATQVGCYEDIGMFVKSARDVAEQEETYLFDAYALGIINSDNISDVTEDNVHLNETGRRTYADLLWKYISEIETGK